MAECAGPPFGAVVAEGYNHVHAYNDPTTHAEIVAIWLACAAVGSPSLAGCTIYSSAEPCLMCPAVIYWGLTQHRCYVGSRPWMQS